MPTNNKIWSEIIGHRIIAKNVDEKDHRCGREFEFTVMEVSPAGRMKLKAASGLHFWSEPDKMKLMEDLDK
jgi:hypothetical protein